MEEEFVEAFNALLGIRGRYSELVGMMVAEAVLVAERRLWDENVRKVRDVLASGEVRLTESGERKWRGLLEEYVGMPSVEEVLRGWNRLMEDGRRELEELLKGMVP